MEYIKGDLLEGKWDYAAHVANSHCVMGSGVAYFLRKKWPQVYEADMEYNTDYDGDEYIEKTPEEKLGHFSVALLDDYRSVFNIYAMWGVGNDGNPLNRNCSYDALYDALHRIAEYIPLNSPLCTEFTIGVPKNMGCCRAGGEWLIVESILQSIEDNFPTLKFIVYDIEGEETAQSSVTI